MKLLLTSAGFTTPEIIDAAVKLCGKPREEIKLGAIVEAYAVEKGDKRWVADELTQAAEAFPAPLDLVNLLALDPEQIKFRLMASDIIYVLGGHTDYLMYVFQKSGLADTLPELLQTKVYVGSSAGGMILGRRISTESYNRIYGEEGTYGVTRYMELVDFAIKPHMGQAEFPKVREDLLLDVSKTFDGRIYALKNTQAIQIDGNQTSFIGGEPLCVQGGEVVPIL